MAAAAAKEARPTAVAGLLSHDMARAEEIPAFSVVWPGDKVADGEGRVADGAVAGVQVTVRRHGAVAGSRAARVRSMRAAGNLLKAGLEIGEWVRSVIQQRVFRSLAAFDHTNEKVDEVVFYEGMGGVGRHQNRGKTDLGRPKSQKIIQDRQQRTGGGRDRGANRDMRSRGGRAVFRVPGEPAGSCLVPCGWVVAGR